MEEQTQTTKACAGPSCKPLLSALFFGPHPAGMGGTRATVFFPNGYGASVITGGMFYTDPAHPYEVAVMKGTSDEDSSLTYETPITDDVLGHQTADDVERVLAEIAALPCA